MDMETVKLFDQSSPWDLPIQFPAKPIAPANGAPHEALDLVMGKEEPGFVVMQNSPNRASHNEDQTLIINVGALRKAIGNAVKREQADEATMGIGAIVVGGIVIGVISWAIGTGFLSGFGLGGAAAGLLREGVRSSNSGS